MSSDFKFDESKSFAENFSLFCDQLDGIDPEMSKIFRANAPTLASVVRGGESDTEARAQFNAAIVVALDTMAAKPSTPEGS